MTPEDAAAAREIAGFIGAAVMSGYLMWRARGRREAAKRDLNPLRNGANARVITRKEWHDLRDLVNNHAFAIQNLRQDVGELKQTFDEHLRQTSTVLNSFTRLEASFLAHVERWEEVGLRAAEDRQDVKESIRTLSKKVDELAADMRR